MTHRFKVGDWVSRTPDAFTSVFWVEVKSTPVRVIRIRAFGELQVEGSGGWWSEECFTLAALPKNFSNKLEDYL